MKINIERSFQQYLEMNGIDVAMLLGEAKIPNLLWKEELKLDEDQFFRLQEVLGHYLTDKQILAISDIKSLQLFMPALFAALSALDGLQALHRFARYKSLVGPVKIDIIEEKDSIQVSLSPASANYQFSYFSVVNELSLILSILRTGTGKEIAPITIKQPYSVGQDILEFWNAPVENGNAVVISFSTESLEQPFLTKNNTMWQMIQPELERQLEELHTQEAFLNIVHQELQRLIVGGEATVDHLASNMGLSTRTLQRKLKKEQTTFKVELQAAQFNMAIGFAKQEQLSTEEIAYLVGYSEVSAFYRAFKKWSGMTFKQYLIVN